MREKDLNDKSNYICVVKLVFKETRLNHMNNSHKNQIFSRVKVLIYFVAALLHGANQCVYLIIRMGQLGQIYMELLLGLVTKLFQD